MMTDHNAAPAGWYNDPQHHHLRCLFCEQASWRGRFVWQGPIASGGLLSGRHERLTLDILRRLVQLGQIGVHDYTRVGGCAIRDLHRTRRCVQVKPTVDGDSVFIQAPIEDAHRRCDPSCQAVSLAVHASATVIRALQVRRRTVLGAEFDSCNTANKRYT